MMRLILVALLVILASVVQAQERTPITRDNLTQVVNLVEFTDTTEIKAIAISPNGQRLAAGNSAGDVTVWDVESGNEIVQWNDAEGEITGLVWQTEERLIGASRDGHMYVFDITIDVSYEKIAPSNGEYPSGLVISGQLAITGGSELVLWAFDDVMLFELGRINPFGTVDALTLLNNEVIFATGGMLYSFGMSKGYVPVDFIDTSREVSLFSDGDHLGLITDKLYTGDDLKHTYLYLGEFPPDKATFIAAPDLVAAIVGTRLQFIDMSTGEMLHQIDTATRGTVKVDLATTGDKSLIAIADDAIVYLFGIQP